MNDKKLHEYFYEVENWMDEFVIAFLSFGFIVTFIDLIFYQSQFYTFVGLGKEIFPWVTMLALMIIGRELWLMNRSLQNYLENNQEEDGE